MNEQSDNTRDKTLREAQKQIVRSSFFALAALAVIVFACYAWFAMAQFGKPSRNHHRPEKRYLLLRSSNWSPLNGWSS